MSYEAKRALETKSSGCLRLLLTGALLTTVTLAGHASVARAGSFVGGGLHSFTDLYYFDNDAVCYNTNIQLVNASDFDPDGTYFEEVRSAAKFSGLQFLEEGYFDNLGFGWISQAAEGLFATPFSC